MDRDYLREFFQGQRVRMLELEAALDAFYNKLEAENSKLKKGLWLMETRLQAAKSEADARAYELDQATRRLGRANASGDEWDKAQAMRKLKDLAY